MKQNKNQTRRVIVLVALITLIGAVLRLYRLGEIPVGFHRDEAFFGYNAYSLLKTGRELTGGWLPLNLASFLYSPAGYSYLTIPFIYLFGLSEFSVRLTSSLWGITLIPLSYLLTVKLIKTPQAKIIALLTASLIALSPWHINLSRVATENVVVVTLMTIALIAYLHWIKTRKWWALLGAFLGWSGTLIVYQAPRAFVPLLIPVIIALYFQKGKNQFKSLIPVLILYVALIILPLITILTNKELSLRIRSLNIFQHPETRLVIAEQIREDGSRTGASLLETRLVHNKVVGYGSLFLKQYAEYFSYRFFFTDDVYPDRYRVPSYGLLHLLELPLLLLGLYALMRRREKPDYLLLLWLLLAPVGSALTFDDIPNLQRTLIMYPALAIIEAQGALTIINAIKSKTARKITMLTGALLIITTLFIYTHQYYVHQLNHRPWYRQEGFKEMVKEVDQRFSQGYKGAEVTTAEGSKSIFFLFFMQIDPYKFQQENKGRSIEEIDTNGFTNITFNEGECPLKDGDIKKDNKIVFVNYGTCKKVNYNGKLLKEVRRNDQTVVFRIYEYIPRIASPSAIREAEESL